MRLVATVLTTSLLAGACGSSTGHYVGGTALLVGSGIIVGVAASEHCAADWSGLSCGIGKSMGLMIAGAAVIGGIALLLTGPRVARQERELAAIEAQRAAIDARTHPAPPPPRLDVPVPATDDAQLRQLTLEARVAARRHQCDGVFPAANLVRARDAAFFTAQFATDPFVAACLASRN